MSFLRRRIRRRVAQVGGERGGDRMLEIMRTEAVRTIQLTGVSSIGELRGRVSLGRP